MSYSDFTLKKVKSAFDLEIIETQSLFADIPSIPLSDYLTKTLERNVPLALSINTEKARSELIIINVLLELKDQLDQKISLFSGIDFSVDKEKGLAGFCDYIVSASSEQLYLEKPVVTIVEAKNENIVSGLGQCIAEMYAAQIFNQNEQEKVDAVLGLVTTGSEWRFIQLTNNIVHVDRDLYSINQVEKIIGILVKRLLDIH